MIIKAKEAGYAILHHPLVRYRIDPDTDSIQLLQRI